MKNISYVIRSLPTEEEAKEITAKNPGMILFAVDIGHPTLEGGQDNRSANVASQVKAAFVAFSEFKIVPMIPSAYMLKGLTENERYTLVEFIKELFENPEVVYVDSGIVLNMDQVKDFVEAIEKVYGAEQKIGVISPASFYIKEDNPLVVYSKEKDNVIPVPFLGIATGVSLQLSALPIVIGDKFEAVISKVDESEKEVFYRLVEPTIVDNIIFWSLDASEGLVLEAPQEEPVKVVENPTPAPEPEEQFETWVSLFSVSIRRSAGMNAEGIGALPADTKVELVPVKELGPDGTKFGKVKHGNGFGYVVIRHGSREYFRRT